MALNKIIVQGRLTADPELKKTSTGNDFTSFNIAVSRNYKNKDGNYPTDFFKVIASAQRAEFICKYFRKGDEIILVGSLETNLWEDKDGNKRTDIYINTDNVYFGQKKDRKTDSAEPALDTEFFEEIEDIDSKLPF